MRHRFARHAHRAHEAQIIGVTPIFVCKLHKVTWRWTASIVDDDIDTAETFGALVDKFLDIFRLGHVGDHRQHFSAGLFAYHFSSIVERRFAAGTNRDLSAFARKTQRRRTSHALAGSG